MVDVGYEVGFSAEVFGVPLEDFGEFYVIVFDLDGVGVVVDEGVGEVLQGGVEVGGGEGLVMEGWAGAAGAVEGEVDARFLEGGTDDFLFEL